MSKTVGNHAQSIFHLFSKSRSQSNPELIEMASPARQPGTGDALSLLVEAGIRHKPTCPLGI